MSRTRREDGRNPRTVANNKYNVNAYDRLAVNVKKGNRDLIKKYAATKNESVNELINRLLAQEVPEFDKLMPQSAATKEQYP